MTAPKTPDAFAAICSDVARLFTHSADVRCDRRRYPRCPGHLEGDREDCHGQRVPYCIPCSYRWAFNAAHDRTKGETGRSGGKGSISDPVATLASELRPDEDHAETERPGHKAVLRRALARASTDVQAAQGLQTRLTKALNRSDSGHGAPVEHADNTSEIGDDELEESLAARRRREERGQGWGAA